MLSEGQKTVGERNVYIDAERNEGGRVRSPGTRHRVRCRRELTAARSGGIADESRVYYLLGYDPIAPLDGRYHKIGVEVVREGLAVYAREGLLCDAPGGKGRDPEVMTDKLTLPSARP